MKIASLYREGASNMKCVTCKKPIKPKQKVIQLYREVSILGRAGFKKAGKQCRVCDRKEKAKNA